jgi:hypothetical protein
MTVSRKLRDFARKATGKDARRIAVGFVPDSWDCAGGCGKHGRHLNHADRLVYCLNCLPKETP